MLDREPAGTAVASTNGVTLFIATPSVDMDVGGGAERRAAMKLESCA